MIRFLAGKTYKASWPKTVQSATGEKSCQIRKETKERREKKKEDRSTVLILSGLVLHSG